MEFNTSRCVKQCDDQFRVVDQDDIKLCADMCVRGQFIGEDFLCHECSSVFENCDVCAPDSITSELLCQSCPQGLNLDFQQ